MHRNVYSILVLLILLFNLLKLKKMKNLILKFVFLFAVVAATGSFLTSCSEKDEPFAGPTEVSTRVDIPSNTIITTNTTWSGNYLLLGKVWVKAPARLTIQPGTVIRGAYSSNLLQASALIITQGASISAKGTATSPIILTADASHQFKGGWGGLVVLGAGAINQTSAQQIEGIDEDVVPSGVDAHFGTPATTMTSAQVDALNAADVADTLTYVRVEYAGAAIDVANELNAFTFGGVGNLYMHHCQAYYGADDAFEFFGGYAEAKYLINTACDDDGFDFDFGFRGKIQFAVSTIDPDASYSSDPNGIECDNDGLGTTNTPYTHPVLSNLTIVGTSDGEIAGGGILSGSDHYLYNGARFRRNTQYTLVNSIAYGYPTGIWNNTGNSSTVENNVVWTPSTALSGQYDYKGFAALSSTNDSVSSYSVITLTNPWGNPYTTNALKPTGAPANTAGYDINAVDSWFDDTEYKGAINKTGDSWLADGELDGWVRNW